MKAKHRIIIDINLWISFLLTSNFSKIDTLVEDTGITLLFSQELIDEFIEVALRPKFKRYFSLDDIEELLTKVQKKAKFITVISKVDRCRDPKDNFLLALAQDGKATHLITGDQDLLILKKFGRTNILTMGEYIVQ
jgi:putative PIN family toxin of toxin-antitoxin system